MDSTVKALQNLYSALGGTLSDVSEITTISDMINSIAGYIGVKDTTVQAEKPSATLFNTKVSVMQTNVVVADGAITGTLNKIEGGIAASGPLAGTGYFLALKFVDNNEADSIKIGLVPSASGMELQELIGDPDMNCVYKVTNKDTQVFKVVTTVKGIVKTQTFDLSGLALNDDVA